MMKLKEFDYELPPSLIAQGPLPERDASRMMVVNRKTGEILHSRFGAFPTYLEGGDVVVVNNSRVIPARLWGKKRTGGRVEILLLAQREDRGPYRRCWEALLKPTKGLGPGEKLTWEGGNEVTLRGRIDEKKWLLEFTTTIPFDDFLAREGVTPLPPYIKRKEGNGFLYLDRERYQTIYARHPGSVAAPTAGLHFSEGVLSAIPERGAQLVEITLHVGYGTFKPVKTEEIEKHRMEEEYYEITKEAAQRINDAKRVIAVGTTCVRTLESATDEEGRVRAGKGITGLFIYPGYRFKRVNVLLTNFHLPKSTLYLLVCAFAGIELIRKAYRMAIEERYRFYSYGDCMLII